MKNQNHILPDELFRQGLNGFEVPFDNAAWENMQAKLNKDETDLPIGVMPIHKKSHIKKIYYIMILVGIVSTLAFFAAETSIKEQAIGLTISSEKSVVENPIYTPTAPKEEISSANDASQNATGNSSNSSKISLPFSGMLGQTELPNTSGLATPNSNAAIEEKTPIGLKSGISDLIETVITPVSAGTAAAKITEPTKAPLSNPVIAEKKVQLITQAGIVQRPPLLNTPKLDGTGSDPYRPTFNGGFVGIHFTRQMPLEVQLKSMDSLRQNAGFNVQFMSRNLFPSPLFGGYMGFDFGMQFYGRSKNSPVV